LASSKVKKAIMQFMLTLSALVPAIAATTAAAAAANNNNMAVLPILDLSLAPNATDILAANGIWAPNLTAFALGEPNTAGIDATAEGEKLLASGLDVNDLVRVSIDMRAGEGGAVTASAKDSCDQCNLCMKACAATLALWFL
jgi:NAD-dependent dihydropyrimidine dehydrogenase PreA subunit